MNTQLTTFEIQEIQQILKVVQEVYDLLLGHWAVRLLIFQAASGADVSPLRKLYPLSQWCSYP